MSNYKRRYLSGYCYFFTIVTAGRKKLFADEANIVQLRSSFRYVMQRRPFKIEAICILPDHIHCIWSLSMDVDYPLRWQMVKTRFTRFYRQRFPENKNALWQPRYWEHVIRDERDMRIHLDYIHYNPVKHGLVKKVSDWRFSSFKKYQKQGLYDDSWGLNVPESIEDLHME